VHGYFTADALLAALKQQQKEQQEDQQKMQLYDLQSTLTCAYEYLHAGVTIAHALGKVTHAHHRREHAKHILKDTRYASFFYFSL
jgi:hypothetical protein